MIKRIGIKICIIVSLLIFGMVMIPFDTEYIFAQKQLQIDNSNKQIRSQEHIVNHAHHIVIQ